MLKVLSKHPHVKLEQHGFLEFEFREVSVRGIQQDIPFSTDSRRWHEQGHGPRSPNPFVSKMMQRFTSGFVPMCWERLQVKSSDLNSKRDRAFDGHKISWPQIRFQVYKGFHGSERQGRRRVDYPNATTVPTTAVQASAFPARSLGSVVPPAYPPEPH